jgi:hypothetical protein
MTRFLRTDDGELVNADRIVRIRDGKPVRPLGRSRATLSDGISVTLTCDIDFIERAGDKRLCHARDPGECLRGARRMYGSVSDQGHGPCC